MHHLLSYENTVKLIYESEKSEVEFPQGGAVINFGKTSLSTYNLVNCIAIGGSFKLKNESCGTFLTHESPTDYIILQKKLRNILNILTEKLADILFIVLFHSDDPCKDKYSDLGGMTTTYIVETMKEFCKNSFPNSKLIIKKYSNSPLYEFFITGNFLAGKVTISPNDFSSSLFPLKSEVKETENKTFVVNVLYNNSYEKIYKCPECENITGTYIPTNPTDVKNFSHTYTCSNIGKIPIEI
jgi:hypothetical protein